MSDCNHEQTDCMLTGEHWIACLPASRCFKLQVIMLCLRDLLCWQCTACRHIANILFLHNVTDGYLVSAHREGSSTPTCIVEVQHLFCCRCVSSGSTPVRHSRAGRAVQVLGVASLLSCRGESAAVVTLQKTAQSPIAAAQPVRDMP